MRGLLVGYGSIGRRHLTNFHDLGVQDWAVVHTGQGTLPLEPPVPVRTYASLEEALDADRPDFAIVANPTNLHIPTTVACVQAGCHVLVEKPVSHSSAGLAALADTMTGGQAQVLVGFQFRFHPALRRIQQLLGDGTIGRPLHARAVWGEYLPAWHPWEDWRTGYAARADLGGGVHHTICHPLDYLRMLFGEASCSGASLTAHGPLGLDVAEAADIMLEFGDGLTVQLHLDYWARPPVHRLEILGTEGSIYWDYQTGEFRLWRSTSQDWASEDHPGQAERNDLFIAEARHFLDVVTGAEPACTLADGMAVVDLCAAIERAAATG